MASFTELLGTKRLKVGTYIGEFATPGIGRMLEVAGCEFAFVDMEHSGFGFETVKTLLRHLHDSRHRHGACGRPRRPTTTSPAPATSAPRG